jgi:glutathione S-transferase
MPSSDVILHHYWESPYAEKVRRILGFKRLAWKSVIIPMMMPKPDLLALTGGYRKTPVLQIGADVYCDTDLIARVIERLRPEPTLFPPGTEALAYALGPWQGELFWLAVQRVGTTVPIFPEGFLEDRSQMVEGGMSLEKLLREVGPQREQLRAKLDCLERQLAVGPFVLGPAPSLADFALFHPVFALKSFPQTAGDLAPFPAVRAWATHIEAFGYGEMTEIPSAAAVEVAHTATPAVASGVADGEPNGLRAGERVSVVHESFGLDPTVGELVSASVHEIAVRHGDERAGEVVVHFPREHYLVMRAGAPVGVR